MQDGPGNFSILQNTQTDYEAHSASYSMGTAVLSRRIKRPESDVNSHISSAEVKNEWIYTSTLLQAFIVRRESTSEFGRPN